MFAKYFIVFVFAFFVAVKASALTVQLEDDDLSDCSQSACDHECRRLDFPGGTCVDRKCTCDETKKVLLTEAMQKDVSENVKSSNKEAYPLPSPAAETRACYISTCDYLCRQLGYIRGVCISGDCYCVY